MLRAVLLGSAVNTCAQGLVAVEDSETLDQVHQLWRAQQRWAFTLDYRPPQQTAASLAANDLLLPPLPGKQMALDIHETPSRHVFPFPHFFACTFQISCMTPVPQ